MTAWQLVWRGVTYFWRTNLAVVLGVATAVAVLSGALLVGHSVRGSLADLVTRRLGAADTVIASPLYFREQLAADIAGHPRFGDLFRAATPMIVADGVVTAQESGRRAGRVKVYGVDDRFWRFHGVAPPEFADREAALSAALARELDVQTGTAVLVRVQRPSDIPLESLHSRKDDVGRTLRLTTRQVLAAAALGEFSLEAQQGDIHAVFVPLARLQEELEVGARVNTLLLAAAADGGGAGALTEGDADAITRTMLRDAMAPDDIGLSIRVSDDGREVVVGSAAGLVEERQAKAVTDIALSGVTGRQVFTYLANTLRVADREVPYSLVAGIDLAALPPADAAAPGRTRAGADPTGAAPADGRRSIVLNRWAADQLSARIGDPLTLDYYVWEDPGQLVTRTADFHVAGIVPLETGSRDLAPDYPGISDATNLRDWDPPFPLDLRRVRPVDEAYWEVHRTTPKAFVAIETAQQLWGSRYGSMTSIRLTPAPGEAAAALIPQIAAGLKATAAPDAFGLMARRVRAENLAASRGATDFGEYFVYFSFFLVVSALVLVVLFFRLGIEQRVREIGLLRAVGTTPGTVRRLFATEGLLLAVVGSLLGMAGAVGYAAALIWALTTWWVDAVGTTELRLHVSLPLLLAGGGGGVLAAVACIWWTLRGLRHISERSLLAGTVTAATADGPPSRMASGGAALLAAAGIGLAGGGAGGAIPPAAAFFGAGAALLIAALMFVGLFLRRPARRQITGHGWTAVTHLAVRQSAHRPGRTVLTMAVLASATFILVTVDAFRREGTAGSDDPRGGTGGYELLVRTLLPVVHDPTSAEGRDELNLFALDDGTRIEPLRVRPGDDASCLNLYQPTNPRIAAPRDEFIRDGRFSFQSAAAATDEERRNPWLLLTRPQPDGAIPVIADANSMTYVLHRGVGDELVIPGSGPDGAPVTLRFVAALQDSIFQSEVLMSTDNFRRLFPDQPGYQMLLVDTKGDRTAVSDDIEQGLADAEADAVDAGAYLASFHRVENTYLSTFQTLGGLGLLLGTVGLATVLLRNILERRRELGLLAAVGYRRSHFVLMAAAENLLIVLGGLVLGAGCAAIAIAPAVADRGAPLLLSADVLVMLAAVFAVAMISSVAAMAAAARSPLLEALRSE